TPMAYAHDLLPTRKGEEPKMLARSVMGLRVARPDGEYWGVLVLDSRDPDMDREQVMREFRKHWTVLRYIVGEL
ncbi:MAG: hypothetical protein OXQ94_09565, partial [Gemmatimonadota bacterium]|nr:hypothetical protein [Gemmatimonadota bacterium]